MIRPAAGVLWGKRLLKDVSLRVTSSGPVYPFLVVWLLSYVSLILLRSLCIR